MNYRYNQDKIKARQSFDQHTSINQSNVSQTPKISTSSMWKNESKVSLVKRSLRDDSMNILGSRSKLTVTSPTTSIKQQNIIEKYKYNPYEQKNLRMKSIKNQQKDNEVYQESMLQSDTFSGPLLSPRIKFFSYQQAAPSHQYAKTPKSQNSDYKIKLDQTFNRYNEFLVEKKKCLQCKKIISKQEQFSNLDKFRTKHSRTLCQHCQEKHLRCRLCQQHVSVLGEQEQRGLHIKCKQCLDSQTQFYQACFNCISNLEPQNLLTFVQQIGYEESQKIARVSLAQLQQFGKALNALMPNLVQILNQMKSAKFWFMPEKQLQDLDQLTSLKVDPNLQMTTLKSLVDQRFLFDVEYSGINFDNEYMRYQSDLLFLLDSSKFTFNYFLPFKNMLVLNSSIIQVNKIHEITICILKVAYEELFMEAPRMRVYLQLKTPTEMQFVNNTFRKEVLQMVKEDQYRNQFVVLDCTDHQKVLFEVENHVDAQNHKQYYISTFRNMYDNKDKNSMNISKCMKKNLFNMQKIEERQDINFLINQFGFKLFYKQNEG